MKVFSGGIQARFTERPTARGRYGSGHHRSAKRRLGVYIFALKHDDIMTDDVIMGTLIREELMIAVPHFTLAL